MQQFGSTKDGKQGLENTINLEYMSQPHKVDEMVAIVEGEIEDYRQIRGESRKGGWLFS